VIELFVNDAPLPASLAANANYTLTVRLNGAVVLPLNWSVTDGTSTVAEGASSPVKFQPVSPVPHTIVVRVMGEFDLPQTYAQTVNIVARGSSAQAGVNWSNLIFTPGENITAVIQARDSVGAPPQSILWTLYRNGVEVFKSSGSSVNYSGSASGLYRLRGTAYCNDGSQLSFDSTVQCSGSVNVRHNLPVPEFGGSLVYLGSVYTQTLAANGGTATSLPQQIASVTEEIFLLPGTTHWTFDIDPGAGPLADEVVLRTQKGNWCLNGLSGGLAGETVGYDYGYMPTYIPAPADQHLRITTDTFSVSSLTYSGYTSRLRLNCYRTVPQGIYRYERCTNSDLPGGEGRRNRRWAAIITEMDVQTDANTRLDRMGVGESLTHYTTVDATSVPLMNLATNGAPNPIQANTGLFYTDSNLYAFYESDGKYELSAHAIAAIEGVRPCCMSLLTFGNTRPLINNRIKRLTGKLSVYLTDGSVMAGSVINVTLLRQEGLASTIIPVNVTETAYADDSNTLLRVGQAEINISDFQFSETGLVMSFSVDESGVTDSTPNPLPTPISSPDNIYSPVWGRTVVYEGACYTNPVYVPVFDGEGVLVTPIGGCQTPICGPAALYCYTSLESPVTKINVAQPFGFPAPFVAYGAAPARCYGDPKAQAYYNGTNVSTAAFTGTQAIDLWAYQTTDFCGESYLYNACVASAAYAASLVVVYPTASTPHAYLSYGDRLYTFAGTVDDYGSRMLVSAADVMPALDCELNASVNGDSVVYIDTQTGIEVPVRFDHLAEGIAHYGVASEIIDDWNDGVTDGRRSVGLNRADTLIYSSTGTGKLIFDVGLAYPKSLVRERAGVLTAYTMPSATYRQLVQVIPGDKVYLRVSDAYGRLPHQLTGKTVAVSWQAIPALPRLYHAALLEYEGSSAINAVGFCAYTNQGEYVFYGTLPYKGSMSGPVNPDSIVTVTAEGTEYNLISASAVGDVNSYELTHLPDYAGQLLNGPFLFKFYAGREAFGAHGEMDVWLDTDGEFPNYFRAGQFSALSVGTYRRDVAPTDTHRNSFAVAASETVVDAVWPQLAVAADGEVISAYNPTGYFVYGGKTFNAVAPDPGLSYSIIRLA
jgi:hypothetical protein